MFKIADRVKVLKPGDCLNRTGHIDDQRPLGASTENTEYRVCFAGSFTTIWCKASELENSPDDGHVDLHGVDCNGQAIASCKPEKRNDVKVMLSGDELRFLLIMLSWYDRRDRDLAHKLNEAYDRALQEERETSKPC